MSPAATQEPRKAQYGPWSGGIVRLLSDRAAQPDQLYDASGFVGTTVGSLVGVVEGREIVNFGGGVPTRWIQWGDGFVQLNSKPTPEVIYNTPGGLAQTLVADEGRGVIYDDKLFVATPGQPCRVYPDRNDLTKFTFLSEKVVSVPIDSVVAGPGPGQFTIDISSSPTTFAQDPQYVLFDRDGDKGAVTANLRVVDSFDGPPTTQIIYTGDDAPAGTQFVRVFIGTDANDLLEPTGFFVWRERLGMWHDNKIQFAGFPGAGSINVDLQLPNELDWTVWDALNFRTIGQEFEDGIIKKVVSIEDRVVAGLSNPGIDTTERSVAGLYDVRGYAPVNAQFENQLIVEKRSSRTGFKSYDSVSVDRDGQAIFFAYGDGFWVFQGINANRIDDPIEEHPLFSETTEFIGITQDLVAFAEPEYIQERSTRDAQGLRSGLTQQVPAIWIFDLKSSSWRLTQRIGTNLDGETILFDSPGHTGGLGILFFNNERKLTIGSGSSLYTMQDEDITSPPIENYHMQRVQSHRHDFGDPVPKRQQELIFHARQRFGLRMPVIAGVEGEVERPGKYVAQAKIRDTLGDLSIYSTHTSGGKGSPRLSFGLGYLGEALLRGQDRDYASYGSIDLDHDPGAQRYLQQISVSGRVDRIDIAAANVIDLSVLIYEDNGGSPGVLRHVSHLNAPRYGLRPASDSYWFPIEFGLDLDGSYFIEVRGEADVRTYQGGGTIVDETGATLQPGNFSMRAVKIIGGTYVSDEIVGGWTKFTILGDVTW